MRPGSASRPVLSCRSRRPFVKIEATRAHGAEVLLDGETISEAQVRAQAIAVERGLTLVHPYDDPLVIAGQGTIRAR